jgi:hypothetical protein
MAPAAGHVGVQVGSNFGGGPFLAGVEVETSHSFGVPFLINASLNGRVGFTFGNILVYGEGGIGSIGSLPMWLAGGGAELALGTNLGVFAEAKALFAFGSGAYAGTQINAGLNVHFGH